MNILDTVLFGMIAGLVTLKVVLLAAATVLLSLVLTERARRRKLVSAPASVRHPRLDEYA